MRLTNWRKKSLIFSLILAVLICVYWFPGSSAILAQNNPAFVGEVRVLELEQTGVQNPAGLAFSSRGNAFHVVAGRGKGQPPPANTDLIKLTAYGDSSGSARIAAAIKDPVNVTFDQHFNRLLIFQSPANLLVEVLEASDGNLDPQSLKHHNAQHFGLQNPQGMAVDPASGHLFILDATGPRLVHVEPEPDGTVDEAVISAVDLQPTGVIDVRGLAFDPTTGHLHLFSPAEEQLYEVTPSGQVVATRDLSGFNLKEPQGMVFAPSGDLTDAPAQFNLYIADSGLPGAQGNQGGEPPQKGQGTSKMQAATQAPGEIVELTFVEPVAPAATSAEGTLIRTIDTSKWSPPSPDPSGLAYLPHSGTLLVSDGEVNEMAIFTGDNLFEASLSGGLARTMTTLSFSDEPVGADVNPANRHLFISDDTGTRSVYELNPGPDGLYDTADDSVTSFKTADFGSSDPEGLAYDPGSGALFVLDGVNREVYRVHPGANGIFDGVDDQVSHFDTLSLGLDDPEGLAFNTNSGTLYAVGKPANTLFELTTGGAVVRTIDISAADARKPAGLALGPGSQNPGELNIYIAARGVDNDSDPNENDGKVYEIALGISIGTPTKTPTSTPVPPTATNTSTSTPTNTPTPGPSLTPTNTPPPTNTPANTATPTNTPVSTGLTLAAVADARVLESNPNTNYGTQVRLDVDSPGEQSYIRFSVPGVTGAVQSATLRLFVTNGSSNGPSIYATDNSWTETGITWNNRPAPTSGVLSNLGSAAAGTWAEYNLTGHITGNGTYSFVLLPDSSDGIRFDSREGSPPPQLVLTFTSGPTPTPTKTPTSTPVPPTATNTPTSTPTNTPTPGPSLTPTNTPPPTNTPANTATPTNTPVSTGLTLAAAADARVLESNPNTNYGSLSRLDVDSPGEESYIRFTVSGVTGAVQSAKLRLFVTNGSSNGPSIYATDNSWTETGITWNNRPAPTSAALANLSAAAVDTWVEYDLTAHITGDGTYSFVLLPDSSDGIRFESREGSPPPELVLTLN